MQTMKTTLKRGRYIWDKINMPATEFQERVNLVQERMGKEGLDALLIYGTGPDEFGNASYISNYFVGMGSILVIVPRSGQVAVFGGAARGIQYAQEITWVAELIPSADFPQESLKFFTKRGSIPSTIGLVGCRQFMPFRQLQSITDTFKESRIVDAENLITDLRLNKSTREYAQIQRASRILTRIFNFITCTSTANMNERSLEAILDREARLEGAEDFRMLIGRPGTAPWALRPVEDSPLAMGERIIVYSAVQFERYWAECIRTIEVESAGFIQTTNPETQAIYDRILQALQAGKTASQFHHEAMAELHKSAMEYIPDYGLGQGIGLDLEEPPVLDATCTKELTSGMSLGLHIGLKNTHTGAIMLGDTVYLSADGPRILTR